jgi:hypothetical protein
LRVWVYDLKFGMRGFRLVFIRIRIKVWNFMIGVSG